MSTYEDYSKTSDCYDQTRSADGVDVIKNALTNNQTPIEEQVLLDAGCGTGLFSSEMVKHVKRIEAVDLNAGMLEQAKSKLLDEQKAGRIAFHHSSIESLPLERESVDAIMINQVLHHLPDGKEKAWQQHDAVMREFARVLKPSGTLVINRTTHEQMDQGFWFYPLIPSALEKVKNKHIDTQSLVALLRSNGFDGIDHQVPLDVVLQGDEYFNPNGPFDPTWRMGDSIWSLVAEEELEVLLTFLKALEQMNQLEQLIHNLDRPRQGIGQLSFTIAKKKHCSEVRGLISSVLK